jgi:hypothetical protein
MIKRYSMKKQTLFLLLLYIFISGVTSCTNADEHYFEKLTSDKSFIDKLNYPYIIVEYTIVPSENIYQATTISNTTSSDRYYPDLYFVGLHMFVDVTLVSSIESKVSFQSMLSEKEDFPEVYNNKHSNDSTSTAVFVYMRMMDEILKEFSQSIYQGFIENHQNNNS